MLTKMRGETRTGAGPSPADAVQQEGTDQELDKEAEEARQMWRDNLAKGYCTQEEFDEQMRILDEA